MKILLCGHHPFFWCDFSVQRREAALCSPELTVQAEGDVDDSFLGEAFQVGDLGTFEVRRCRRVTHVNPAHRLLGVHKVHGGGLLGAGGQQAVNDGAAQGGGLDVLGVGDQQDRQTVHRHCRDGVN